MCVHVVPLDQAGFHAPQHTLAEKQDLCRWHWFPGEILYSEEYYTVGTDYGINVFSFFGQWRNTFSVVFMLNVSHMQSDVQNRNVHLCDEPKSKYFCSHAQWRNRNLLSPPKAPAQLCGQEWVIIRSGTDPQRSWVEESPPAFFLDFPFGSLFPWQTWEPRQMSPCFPAPWHFASLSDSPRCHGNVLIDLQLTSFGQIDHRVPVPCRMVWTHASWFS